MILRILRGHLATDPDSLATSDPDLRERFLRAARTIAGLESLIVGVRPGTDGPDAAIIVTVWRDVDAMVRVTTLDETASSLAARLDLPFTVARSEHFEVADRTFAALPPADPVLIEVLSIVAAPNEEARLMDALRGRQPRLVELGLIAANLGRRIGPAGVEAMLVTVWPADIADADRSERAGLADWEGRSSTETYVGVEIAPRIPDPKGPPLLILDDSFHIADLTPTAAAMLGLPSEEMVGDDAVQRSAVDPMFGAAAWGRLRSTGSLVGRTAWAVPDGARSSSASSPAATARSPGGTPS